MTSINISIKSEAYNFLKSLKTQNESFSEIILGFKEMNLANKGNKKNIMKFAGILKDRKIDWEKKEKEMNKFRKETEERLK